MLWLGATMTMRMIILMTLCLFDTITPQDVEPTDPLDTDLVPECPPDPSDVEYSPPSSVPTDDEAS